MSLLVLILSLFNLAKAATLKSSIDTRVIGGEIVTKREDFPYMVSIRFDGDNFCGGAIITSQHVLTAATCLHDSEDSPLLLKQFGIVAGDLNTKKPSANTVVRNVIAAKHHKDYNFELSINDIAVLKIDQEFEWTPFVSKIELANKTSSTAGKQCVVSGWGVTTPSGTKTDDLHSVKLPIIAESTCKEMYLGLIQPGMFCAGYTEGGKDTCLGDAGGPLACDGILYGIVSWGAECAAPNLTGVYTDVAYYRNWILEEGLLTESTGSLHRQCIVLLCIIIFSYL